MISVMACWEDKLATYVGQTRRFGKANFERCNVVLHPQAVLETLADALGGDGVEVGEGQDGVNVGREERALLVGYCGCLMLAIDSVEVACDSLRLRQWYRQAEVTYIRKPC